MFVLNTWAYFMHRDRKRQRDEQLVHGLRSYQKELVTLQQQLFSVYLQNHLCNSFLTCQPVVRVSVSLRSEAGVPNWTFLPFATVTYNVAKGPFPKPSSVISLFSSKTPGALCCLRGQHLTM